MSSETQDDPETDPPTEDGETSNGSDNSLSKFVEHLRTTHFTLVVASITLLVFCLSVSRRDVKAGQQLDGILKALESWAEIGAEANRGLSNLCSEWEYFGYLDSYEERRGQPPQRVQVGTPYLHLRVREPCLFAGLFTQEDLKGALKKPGTLEELRDQWNTLRDVDIDPHIYLHRPESIFSLRRRGGKDQDEFELSFRWFSAKPEIDSEPVTIDMELGLTHLDPASGRLGEVFKGLFAQGTREWENQYWLTVNKPADEQTPEVSIRIVGAEKPLRGLPVQVRELRREIGSLQEAFIKETGSHFRPGSFPESFRALDAAARDHDLWNQELTKARKKIAEELDKQTAPKIIGIEIPAKMAALLTSILVVLFQAYFVLHLARFVQLTAEHGVQVPGETPWIGVYPGRFPRGMSIFTSSFLPLGANAYALYGFVRARLPHQSLGEGFAQTSFLVLFLLAALALLASLVLAITTWLKLDEMHGQSPLPAWVRRWWKVLGRRT